MEDLHKSNCMQRQDIKRQLQGEQLWLEWEPRTSTHLPVSVAASEGLLLKWGPF